MIFIPRNIWEKQLIHLGSEKLAATMLTVLSQNVAMLQVEKATYRVIDTSFRLYNEFYAEKYSRYLCDMHGMS